MTVIGKGNISEHYFYESDLSRRILLREEGTRADHRKKATIRKRIRCTRCNKEIPETRRSHAIYCSENCKNHYRWERQRELEKEIRLAVRTEKIVPECKCGEKIDTRIRPGPIPTQCKKCHMRNNQRRYRARLKQESKNG